MRQKDFTSEEQSKFQIIVLTSNLLYIQRIRRHIQFVLNLPEPMKKIKGFHSLEYFFKALGWKSGKDVEHFKSTHSHESEAKYQCESIVASDLRDYSNLSTDIKLQTGKYSTISVSELRFENGILKEQLRELQNEVKQMKRLMDENSSGANDGNHDHPYLVEVSFFLNCHGF